MPSNVFKLKFDIGSLWKDVVPARYDVIPFRNNTQNILGHIDARAQLLGLWTSFFDSSRAGATPQIFAGRFNAAARQSGFFPNRLDALRLDILVNRFLGRFDATPRQVRRLCNRLDALRFDKTGGFFVNRFDAKTLQNAKLPFPWDSVNNFPNGVGRLAFSYDSYLSYLWKIFNRFQSISDYVAKINYSRILGRFHAGKPSGDFLPVRFDCATPGLTACLYNRFDITGRGLYLYPARKQAFVRPGWRIIAKNILTDEILDLGFIDDESENHALENIFLPDGDYEISVLTSSLFWKDATNFEPQLFSIRPGEEVTPLPVIYNFRSSVLLGETTIYWSANHSDVSDCVFGIWYSPTSPVPTDGPPSETVWYFSEMTEYQTSFKQFSPCYAAVAAMKPGNALEIGKVHEIFLDWNAMPPRAPDDVVVYDNLPPVIDVNAVEVPPDNENLTLCA